MKQNDKEYLQGLALIIVYKLKPDAFFELFENDLETYKGLVHVFTMLQNSKLIANFHDKWNPETWEGRIIFTATPLGIAIRNELETAKWKGRHVCENVIKIIEKTNHTLTFVLE